MWGISLLFVLLTYCRAGLVIKSPESARRYFGDGEGALKMGIPSTGVIPYGTSMTGQLLYIESNKEGCNPFYFDLQSELRPHPFVLVKYGNCSLSTMIKNVQTDGGKLMILVSNYYPPMDKFPTADYEPADFINIPAVVITEQEATKLIGVYKALTDQGMALEMEAKFEVEQSWDIVQLEFWFQTIDPKVVSFIRDFKSMRETLGRNIHFIPHY